MEKVLFFVDLLLMLMCIKEREINYRAEFRWKWYNIKIVGAVIRGCPTAWGCGEIVTRGQPTEWSFHGIVIMICINYKYKTKLLILPNLESSVDHLSVYFFRAPFIIQVTFIQRFAYPFLKEWFLLHDDSFF